MDRNILFRQMINFQKETFDNSFKAMTTLQEQGEKMVSLFLDQATWLPDEGKKAVTEWVDAYKKGRDDFRETVDANFHKVQDYFAGSESNTQ